MLETDYLYSNDMIAQCEAAIINLEKENDEINILKNEILAFVEDEELISRRVSNAKLHFYDYYLICNSLIEANQLDIESYNKLKNEISSRVSEDLCGNVIFSEQRIADRNYAENNAKALKYRELANQSSLIMGSPVVYMMYSSMASHYKERAGYWKQMSQAWEAKKDLFDEVENLTSNLFPSDSEVIQNSVFNVLENIKSSYQNGNFQVCENIKLRENLGLTEDEYNRVKYEELNKLPMSELTEEDIAFYEMMNEWALTADGEFAESIRIRTGIGMLKIADEVGQYYVDKIGRYKDDLIVEYQGDGILNGYKVRADCSGYVWAVLVQFGVYQPEEWDYAPGSWNYISNNNPKVAQALEDAGYIWVPIDENSKLEDLKPGDIMVVYGVRADESLDHHVEIYGGMRVKSETEKEAVIRYTWGDDYPSEPVYDAITESDNFYIRRYTGYWRCIR